MKTGPIPGFILLIRNLVIAEIILSLIFFGLDRFVDLENLYTSFPIASNIDINIFTLIVIIVSEVLVVTTIIYRWLRNSNLQPPPANLAEILKQKEHQSLECKQTLRYDIHEQKLNKNLAKASLKSIAAFANSQGGNLVIGVNDDFEVTGLENDYQTLNKKNRDGFELLLSQLIIDYLSLSARNCCDIQIQSYHGKDVCLVTVKPSEIPIYYQDGPSEEFFIRNGNNTSSLTISQANQYIANHSNFSK